MGFYKKTVLLSNQSNYDNGMAILTIEQNNSGVFGSIKVFDVPKNEKLILGISLEGKPVIKQNVMFLNGNIYNFKLNNEFDINGKIGCVLVEIMGDNVKALLWGTNGNQAQYKQDIIHIIEKDVVKTETVKKESIKTEQIVEQHTDKVVNQNDSDEYKAELFEIDENEVEEIIEKELEGGEFYELIHEQIDELFKKFPEDEGLKKLIPNSKWIKVDYENNGKEYVFGLIYEREKIKYICYGVPSRREVSPPKELEAYSQWLPLGEDSSVGYWVMFQDADTGDSIVIDDVKFS